MQQPHTDALDTIGTLLTGDEGRDAVHIAVAPVVAATRLSPGQRVAFAADGDTTRVTAATRRYVGIIDPFLAAPVEAGQRCWLFLTPRTITGLRHVWTHPAFPDNGEG